MIKSFISAATLITLTTFTGFAVDHDPQTRFFDQLKSICGHSYVGKVTKSNESDEKWRTSKLVIHAPSCDADMTTQIKIPLHVGADKSRTWIISKVKDGLELKHDHRHKDGTPDEVTMYGGTTLSLGTPSSQDFPADDYSKKLFKKTGLDASVQNTWTLSTVKGQSLTYSLNRPNRAFQVVFDLTKPLKMPTKAQK